MIPHRLHSKTQDLILEEHAACIAGTIADPRSPVRPPEALGAINGSLS